MLRRNMLKMDQAGGGDGSGGAGGAAGGAGAAGNGAAGSGGNGGGGLLTGQGAGAAGAGAGAQGAPAGDGNNGGKSQGAGATDWKSSLPKELQEDPALSVISDVAGLAKSYVNAQKLIGANKVAIPGKHATPEDWRDVYHKLGLPQKMEEYKVDVPKETSVGADFLKSFTEEAFKLGIMPNQAQQLVQFFETQNKSALEAMQGSQANAAREEVRKLREEWGAAFDEKLSLAQEAVSHLADKETIDYLNKSGLTNDTKLVRLFSKVADLLKEDGLIGKEGAGTGVLTPAAAQKEIDAIMRDFNHPYYNVDHPNHKAAVEDVTRLFNLANGRK